MNPLCLLDNAINSLIVFLNRDNDGCVSGNHDSRRDCEDLEIRFSVCNRKAIIFALAKLPPCC